MLYNLLCAGIDLLYNLDLIFFLVPRYYAWDYRVLKTFAKHYSTGDEIPQKLVESMLGAKNMFAATDLQRQVFFHFVFFRPV